MIASSNNMELRTTVIGNDKMINVKITDDINIRNMFFIL